MNASRVAGLVLVALGGVGVGAVAEDALPRMTRLADGVFTYEHADPTKAGVTANNLVVIGAAAVLVADGQGTVENTVRVTSTTPDYAPANDTSTVSVRLR